MCFGQSDPIVRAHLMSEAIRRLMSEAIRRLMSEAIRPNQTGAAVVCSFHRRCGGILICWKAISMQSDTHMALRWYNLLEGRWRPNLSQIQVIQRHPATGT